MDPKLTFWCVSYYLGAFGTVWLPYRTRCKTGRTSAKERATKSRRNISQTRSTPLDPKLTFWCVWYYLGAFGTVFLAYETRCITGRTSAKVCATKSHRNFSQRMHPIHPVAPYTDVLVRFVLFGCIRDRGCLTKLVAKRAEVVQKFVPRSRIGIFRNKHTRSTPLHLKLIFWGVSYYLGAFGTVVALRNSLQNGPK